MRIGLPACGRGLCAWSKLFKTQTQKAPPKGAFCVAGMFFINLGRGRAMADSDMSEEEEAQLKDAELEKEKERRRRFASERERGSLWGGGDSFDVITPQPKR